MAVSSFGSVSSVSRAWIAVRLAGGTLHRVELLVQLVDAPLELFISRFDFADRGAIRGGCRGSVGAVRSGRAGVRRGFRRAGAGPTTSGRNGGRWSPRPCRRRGQPRSGSALTPIQDGRERGIEAGGASTTAGTGRRPAGVAGPEAWIDLLPRIRKFASVPEVVERLGVRKAAKNPTANGVPGAIGPDRRDEKNPRGRASAGRALGKVWEESVSFGSVSARRELAVAVEPGLERRGQVAERGVDLRRLGGATSLSRGSMPCLTSLSVSPAHWLVAAAVAQRPRSTRQTRASSALASVSLPEVVVGLLVLGRLEELDTVVEAAGGVGRLPSPRRGVSGLAERFGGLRRGSRRRRRPRRGRWPS